jgi:hypothetical protein
MPAVSVPFLAAAFLLVAAGGAKLARPDEIAGALRAAGLPAGRRLVRCGAAVEAAVGAAGLALPGAITASLVAASYFAFAGFVGLAIRRGWPIASCGCFGRPDTKPGYPHLLLDAGAAAAAASWAASGPPTAAHVFVQGPVLLLSAIVSGLSYLAWTARWA